MAESRPSAAGFDQAALMLRATAAFLHGKSVTRLARPPSPSAPRLLPRLIRQKVLARDDGAGVDESQALAEADAEAVAQWMAASYPRRRYPAIVLGLSSGALVHLCAALGVPWLPETYQVPMRPVPRLSGAAADQPATRPATHFRVTWHRLSRAYKAFLSRSLLSGGSILVVEKGVIPAVPRQDGGIDPGLLDDLLDFARRRGAGVVRLAVGEPKDLSPLVADLYGWWYRRRGIIARRLLATSLIVTDPLWTFRIGAVPFWLEFVTEPSAAGLERYLEMRPPFDYINLCLFQQERPGAEVPPIERWHAILAHAKRRGDFVGVDAASYPADVSSFGRYQAAVKRIPARYPVPAPLLLEEFGGFLRYAERYHLAVEPMDGRVRWLE